MAPSRASALAIPQAIEWSLATPMINPRLPSIRLPIPHPAPCARRARARLSMPPEAAQRSGIEPLEYDRRIGTAEPERVRQYAGKLHIVPALADDGNVGKGRIEILDVGALADEAVAHHQERIDRLLGAGGAERMAGQRLGRGNRRAFRSEHFANCLDLAQIPDQGRGRMRVDVVD